jgi:antitoxin CptB
MGFLGGDRVRAAAVSEDSRLRWRCRRGMRELDQLLGWYLDARFAQADTSTQGAFVELLDQQDPELWNWLSGRAVPEHARWRSIIDEIRARDRV